AIAASNLGLTPSTEGQVLRLRIPELNEERRRDLVKVAHKYAEAARVAIRHVRRDGLDVLKKLEKDHKISEDDGKRSSEQVQKATDEVIAEVDKMLAAKEKEILTVWGRSRCRRPSRCALSRSAISPCRGMSPSSWTATGAGRPRADCRAGRDIGAEWTHSPAPFVPPAISASVF